MPIWTFDLPDDAQPSLVLDLSTLSVVTAPGTGSAITVEADESLTPPPGRHRRRGQGEHPPDRSRGT